MDGFVKCISNDDNNGNFTLMQDYDVIGKSIMSNFGWLELDVKPVDVLNSKFKFAFCEFKRV